MDDNFYEAAIPEPWTILGRRLKPFSLGHIFILSRVGSAFISGKADILPLEIVQAVFICSHTYSENLKLLDDPNLVRKIRDWKDEVSGEGNLLVRLGLKKPIHIDWLEKAEMFRKYLSQSKNIPTYSVEEGKVAKIDLPSPQIVKITLMRYVGFTEEQIMDRPWNMCIWDFVTLKAMEGQISVYDEDELNQAREAANKFAEKLKQGKGANNATG